MIITKNKNKMVYQINNTLVETNFIIGKIIVENEQSGNIRAEYGKDILNKLSRKLTKKFGSGFSRSGLQNMRLFYIKYKNCQPLAGNLSWSHYCYLIYIEDDDERSFYEIEAAQNHWGIKELNRQCNSALYERLALSKDKDAVMEMSRSGTTPYRPADILKSPYVLEFAGLDDKSSYHESDLEFAVLNKMQDFLLEMGKRLPL